MVVSFMDFDTKGQDFKKPGKDGTTGHFDTCVWKDYHGRMFIL